MEGGGREGKRKKKEGNTERRKKRRKNVERDRNAIEKLEKSNK